MAHFTASPFHKPLAFEFPRPIHPLTPPESDYLGPAQSSGVMPAGPIGASHDSEHADSSHVVSPPDVRLRRGNGIGYHSSGLRESRERTVQKSSKSLVVVIPPASFSQQHGALGHTLSNGPIHRLSQGILMPLFPTMYAQLAAIAHEFNFPSTTGICLYLHYSDGATTITPRISEVSWQFIWGHVFGSSPAVQLPAISGRVEFDIDVPKARWYTSWLTSAHREEPDMPISVAPSRAASELHFRAESMATSIDDRASDFPLEDIPFVHPSRVTPPASRHVPRRLSLVDRIESSSIRSGAKPGSRAALLAAEQVVTHALSPIFQEEEPKTAKVDLENRVNSWRATTAVQPTSSAAIAHAIVESANAPDLPTSADRSTETVDLELNLDDFAWTVSSAGPSDYDPDSPMSWDRLPSVHLAERMESSVCLTPSVCTSFGPSDCDLEVYSPVQSASRLPSPDLGLRMLEDAPLTPSTATSWGPPLSWPASPCSDYRPPSLDLGHRAGWSRPATPTTATSWEAPVSYPPIPVTPDHIHTPDIAHHVFESDQPSATQNWGFVFPYYDSQRVVEGAPANWSFVFPYYDSQRTAKRAPANWPLVFPYLESTFEAEPTHLQPVSIHLSITYPSLRIYRAVYPHFEIYPDVSVKRHVDSSFVYPNFDLYPALSDGPPSKFKPRVAQEPIPFTTRYSNDNYSSMYPYNLGQIYAPAVREEKSDVAQRPLPYPSFDLYPAIYPYVIPYPSTVQVNEVVSGLRSKSGYPHFDLYPAIELGEAKESRLLSIHVAPGYPSFNLYPPIYPAFAIYPPIAGLSVELEALPATLCAVYPSFNLYPALYPAFEIYPTVQRASPSASEKHIKSQYPHFDLYPSTSQVAQDREEPKPLSVAIKTSYPTFNLYPSIYPEFDIYPTCDHKGNHKQYLTTIGYPDFNLYPAVDDHKDWRRTAPTGQHKYPMFHLYPAVYPHFDLYPCRVTINEPLTAFSGSNSASYPDFKLYPPVYPHFDLYPCKATVDERFTLSGSSSASYPDFKLYPPIYPHFDLYPSRGEILTELSRNDAVTYPHFNLYPSVYPHFDLYPAFVDVSGDVGLLPTIQHPTFILYSAVHNSTDRPKRRRTHADLHATVLSEKFLPVSRYNPTKTHNHLHLEVLESEASSMMDEKSESEPLDSRPTKPFVALVNRTAEGHKPPVENSFAPRAEVPIPRSHNNSTSVSLGPVSRPRSGSINTRVPWAPTLSTTTAAPVSIRKLPTLPSSSPDRAQTPPTFILPTSRQVSTSRLRSLPSNPADPRRLSTSRPLSNYATRAIHPLSPVEEIRSQSETLNRASSVLSPAKPQHPAGYGHDRSNSLSTPAARSAPRRRDSLVLQRVKAYNSSVPESEVPFADTLSKFPMPPPPPVPPVPTIKKLDHSKFPFS